MLDWENEKDPLIKAMLEKAWLYGKMADDLRAQAAKAIYEREHPDKKLTSKAQGKDTSQ